MKSGVFKRLCIGMWILPLLLLTGCVPKEPEPTVPQYGWLREKAEYLTVLAQEEDFVLLEECVNLQYLNLTGSTCYDAILDYISRHPEVEVIYAAPLGNQILTNKETGIALEPCTYTAEALMNQLKYLPSLETMELPRTSLTAEQLAMLQEAYPDLLIRYSADILGKEYLTDCTAMDLSGLTLEQIRNAAESFPLLPALTEVELMDENDNSLLSPADVKWLMDTFPRIRFHYTFDLFGKRLSCEEETVEYIGVSIGDEGEAQIRAALDIMPHCTYFKLEDCGLSNEVLASIRDDYPNTKIVWRVYLGQYSLCTDAETLRTVYGVYNKYADTLKYCTDLKYIDMGHNVSLSDISFIEYMPNLEIVILSGSAIKNVDPFAVCKNLEWLELAYCSELSDISALENCEKLRFLNLSFSKVRDLTAADELPLERFVYLQPKVNWADREAFKEKHPDCWIRFTGSDPYSLGWRYNDIGITRFEFYQKIRDIFQYDEVDKQLARQEAAKKKEEEADSPSDVTQEDTTPPVTDPPVPPADSPPSDVPET